jgi:hypothetical protein
MPACHLLATGTASARRKLKLATAASAAGVLRTARTEVVSKRAVHAGGRLGPTPCMATMSE